MPGQTQWVILDDPELLIDSARLAGPSVRTMRTFEYRGTDDEDAMPIGAMDLLAAQRLAKELLGERAKAIAGHMLESVPGFIRNVASGMTPEEATLTFETENRIQERFAQLGVDGRLFASFLLTTHGAAKYSREWAATYFDFLQKLGFDPAVMRHGLELCLESRVVVQIDDHIVLAPEFSLLRNKWFSHWAQDSLRALQYSSSCFSRSTRTAPWTSTWVRRCLAGPSHPSNGGSERAVCRCLRLVRRTGLDSRDGSCHSKGCPAC